MTSLPGHLGHVTSFPFTGLPPPASYGPVGAQIYPELDLLTFYSHFQVTTGPMTSIPGHFRYVTSFPVT